MRRFAEVVTCVVAWSVAWQPANAEFTLIDETYFGVPAVVGEDPIEVGQPTVLGFDMTPDGSAVATPNPSGHSWFYSEPVQTTFESVGVRFGADDVAVSQPGNPAGIGARSAPNTLASDPSSSIWGPHGLTEIIFVDPFSGQNSPTPAAGAWFADGPTNDVQIAFYTLGGQLITTLVAPDNSTVWFAGIASDQGIARMEVSVSQSDDYYVEDLYYIPTSIPEPSTLTLLSMGTLALLAHAWRRRRGR